MARSWRRIGWLHSGGFGVPKSLASRKVERIGLNDPNDPNDLQSYCNPISCCRNDDWSKSLKRHLVALPNAWPFSVWSAWNSCGSSIHSIRSVRICRLLTSWRPWMQQWLAKKNGPSGSMSQYSQFRSTTSSCTPIVLECAAEQDVDHLNIESANRYEEHMLRTWRSRLCAWNWKSAKRKLSWEPSFASHVKLGQGG